MQEYRGNEFSMIFQDSMTSLNPTMKIGKQICEAIRRWHTRTTGSQARDRAVELLTKVGLPNPDAVMGRYPHTMSGGQRQRVMIALALACNPAILFADEPTTALDVTIQAQILALMNEIKRRDNMGIIFYHPQPWRGGRMADRVAVMYAGQIVESGSLNDIFYFPATPIPGDCWARCPISRWISAKADQYSGDPARSVRSAGGMQLRGAVSVLHEGLYRDTCRGTMRFPRDIPPGAGFWTRPVRRKWFPPVGRDKTVLKISGGRDSSD